MLPIYWAIMIDSMHHFHWDQSAGRKRRFKADEEIPLEAIEEAYRIYAWIVRQYGDAYLPTFIRMHEELEKRKSNEKMKQIAIDIANDTA